VTMMLISMATHIADPRKRLAAIITATTKAKALTGGMKNLIPTDLPSLGIPWLMSVITPLYRTAVASNRIPVVANLVVSNVPGPQVPLYLAGAELITYYPVSIVTHGLALNITIQSYAGKLYYGLIACKEAVPDLRKFAGHIKEAHEDLLALSRAPAKAQTRTTRAKKVAGKARTDAQRKTTAKVDVKSRSGSKGKAAAPPAGKPATRPATKVAAGSKAKKTAVLKRKTATAAKAPAVTAVARQNARKKRA